MQDVQPLPYGFLDCLSDDVVDRINQAVKLNRSDVFYYSIANLPSVLTWGAGLGTSVPTDDSRFIMQGKGKVKILIIGRVTKSYLRGTERNRGSCSLNVVPLFEAERERLDDLVKGFSSSSKGVSICSARSYPVANLVTVKGADLDISKSGIMVSNSIGVVSGMLSYSRAFL